MNKVFIATSLDGFIADDNGSVDFLYKYPEQPGEDMGYYAFMDSVDALVMGRKTFETVLSFGVDWPYSKPVFVWTTEMKSVPSNLAGKVHLISGNPSQIIQQLNLLNYINLYIDGGKTIQSFLEQDLIDELTITTIPVLLGSGISLFGQLNHSLYFNCIASKCYLHGVTQSTFKRQAH